MVSYTRIRERLPSLYRPELDDPSLLTLIMRAVGDRLDELNGESSQVMQAHWYEVADRAIYDPFFLRSRTLLNLPPLRLVSMEDRATVEAFPYIHDLARLAALLALPPWREPPHLRERVEEYRLRIRRMVALYRGGLGTTKALRAMVEAQLPVDFGADPGREDRPFWLEESAPLVRTAVAVTQPGEPADMVGPLMRWALKNDGVAPAPATLYIQGVAPVAGAVDATTDPLVELYLHGSERPRVTIGLRGTLAAGETLRLRPAFTSWLAGANGLRRAAAVPTAGGVVDPTAPGPWQAIDGLPAAFGDGAVAAVQQTEDRVLWFAVNEAGGAGALWRHDGRTWQQALAVLPPMRCLAADPENLWIGTDAGLLQVSLFGGEGAGLAAELVTALGGETIHTIFTAADGNVWIGTESGLALRTRTEGGTYQYQPFVLHAGGAGAAAVYAVAQDPEPNGQGALYFGTSAGLFQFQPAANEWYWYAGGGQSDQVPDWQPLLPDADAAERNFPSLDQVFLPAVRAIHRGPDASLWLGTDQGIARYTAHAVDGFTFETRLEAFPDLHAGPVSAIREDERGLVWFGTDRGLFRYDGRDWWQFQEPADGWVQLGRADTLYSATISPEAGRRHSRRGSWRFHPETAQWQRFDPAAADWKTFAEEVRSGEAPPVRTIFWADHVAADLGTWDGANFVPTGTVDLADIVMRYKVDETRIVDGGFPAVPRLPVGDSTWRYLALEPAEVDEPEQRPAWTIEGRLLPPPTDRAPAPPGRYDAVVPPPSSSFDEAVFAFPPAARVWFEWEAKRALAVLVRLKKQQPEEQIDPAILDRVWLGMQQVRPAGVRTALAVEEEIVKG